MVLPPCSAAQCGTAQRSAACLLSPVSMAYTQWSVKMVLLLSSLIRRWVHRCLSSRYCTAQGDWQDTNTISQLLCRTVWCYMWCGKHPRKRKRGTREQPSWQQAPPKLPPAPLPAPSSPMANIWMKPKFRCKTLTNISHPPEGRRSCRWLAGHTRRSGAACACPLAWGHVPRACAQRASARPAHLPPCLWEESGRDRKPHGEQKRSVGVMQPIQLEVTPCNAV